MNLKRILKENVPILADSYYWGKKHLIPFKVRMGGALYDVLSRLEMSQWWTRQEIVEYQWKNIKLLIDYAYENVPFYTRLFKNNRITPKDIISYKEFAELPFLTKNDIRAYKDELVSKKYPKGRLIRSFTGGTTGAPVEFYEDKVTKLREKCFYWRYWYWHGYRWGDKCALLRGNNKTNKHYYNHYDNYLEIGCGKLDDQGIQSYLKELKEFRPAYMQAYPSIAYLVAKYINGTNQNDKFNFIKAVFCTSEKLFSYQKKEIQEAFNCRIVENYGHCEKAVLIQQCERESLHIIPEYGYTELIDGRGNPVHKRGTVGELVGTGFNNYAFPFLRYRTGDMATLEKGKCNCGRDYSRISDIQGRHGDFIITPSGMRIPSTVIEFAFDSIRNVKEWQIIQRRIDLIVIMIVKNKGYDPKGEPLLISRLKNIIKDDIAIQINYVDNIVRPDNMKYRFVISNIEK